jgi:hypothetical protein
LPVSFEVDPLHGTQAPRPYLAHFVTIGTAANFEALALVRASGVSPML